MTAQEWYEQSYCTAEEYTSQDLVESIKDPAYRVPGWVPKWDEAEFKRAQMELTAELRQNGLKVEGFFKSEDPRKEMGWRDSSWDDVLLDQWWRYVVKQYHRHLAQDLINNGLMKYVDLPGQNH